MVIVSPVPVRSALLARIIFGSPRRRFHLRGVYSGILVSVFTFASRSCLLFALVPGCHNLSAPAPSFVLRIASLPSGFHGPQSTFHAEHRKLSSVDPTVALKALKIV